MKRALCVLLLAALCLLAGIAGAAAPAARVWISPTGEETADALYLSSEDGEQYTLFLPAAFPLADARFGMEGVESLTVSGAGKVETGDSAAFLAPGKYSLKLGKKSASLRVLRGSEGLPALYITTESGGLTYIEGNKNRKEAGYLMLRGADGALLYGGALEHIKIRGNSSVTFVKKNYQIKLQTGASLLGFGKAKKWILTGNYRDKSCLRNQLMLDLAMEMGLPYTPEHTMAELYINHEYRGLYLFSEKVEIDDDRIDIPDLEAQTEELNGGDLSRFKTIGPRKATRGSFKGYEIPEDPEDISGGYLIEYESYLVRYKQEKSAYTTRKGAVVVVKSPEYASRAQMKVISHLVQAFENAVFAKDGKDPGTGLHYSELMDVPSLTAKYMLEELCKNYDGNSSSQFFFKPADAVSPKLFAGPAWDYDSTFGSYAQKRNARYVLSGSGMWISTGAKNYWYPQLYTRPEFREEVCRLWNGRMRTAVEVLLGTRPPEEGSVLRSIDDYAEAIRDSAEMYFVRWPRKKKPSTVAQTGHTFQMNIDYVKQFLTDRYDYLNREWAGE